MQLQYAFMLNKTFSNHLAN